MKHLDKQLARFSDQLCKEVKLSEDQANKVATMVAAEIRFLPVTEAKKKIQEGSPVLLSRRYEELYAFQLWSEFSSRAAKSPAVTRASLCRFTFV